MLKEQPLLYTRKCSICASRRQGVLSAPEKAGKRMKRSKKGTCEHKFPGISKKSNLEVTELHGREIFQVEGVLSVAESERFIDAAESSGFQATTSKGPAFGEAYRDNSRMSVDSKALADLLWQNGSLQEVFQDYPINGSHAVGLNPNIRFYKYERGNKFGKHVDDSVRVGSRETKYTLLLYLSGGAHQKTRPDVGSSKALAPLKGGETLFYGGKRSKLLAAVAPQPGLALLHLHGDDCLEHEGAEVQSGVKYVLRSDVLY